ncbi:MAG: NADH-quinone oxidoreductase subunit N [Candidatus Kapabacteria bacterium]|nr:NADH-quinone oxidoreductase subunit N [Ignavibacteriota bacterium]MCW5885588.1 NADH-quinone oxidoreductase subunit N [Candidatus Kapabacteria bacterium]
MYDAIVNDLLNSLGLFRPELALLATFVLVIIADLVFKNNKVNAGISILGSLVTAVFLIMQSGIVSGAFQNLTSVDPFADFFKMIIIISTILVLVMSEFSEELHKRDVWMGEYYMLVLGMAIGMFLLAGASNLILIYLAVETMSMSSYVLAGYTKEIKRSSEASLKYVIFGSLSSGIMIYGMSLMFGMTGSLNIYEIQTYFMQYGFSELSVFISGLMIIAGFAYKISAVPFHFWTPDVYEGSPVSITAYLSVASKAAGFAIFIRFMRLAFLDTNASSEANWALLEGLPWDYIIAIFAIATMTLGNFVALWQSNVKRMLAYSSIAHAGYLLMGVVVMSSSGIMSILVYFFFYMLMNFGAFFVVMLFAHKIGSEELDDYEGLGYRAPVMATFMTIFMVSLTGLPPTAGFVGKLVLFGAVLEGGWYWMAVIGVLNSVISLFYYAKVIRNMWVRKVEAKKEPFSFSYASQLVVFMLALPTLIFGLFYGPILRWAEFSVKMFLGN